MRITLVTHSLDPGGSTAFTLQLANWFTECGDTVNIVTGAASSASSLTTHQVAPAFRAPRARAIAYRDTILSTEPDVVYSLSGVEEFHVLALLEVPRVRHVFSLETFRATNIPWMIRRCAPHVELFTANTPDVGEFIRAESPETKFAVAPYLLDPEWFDDAARPAQKPDAGVLSVAFVGRLEALQKRARWLAPIILACERAGVPLHWHIFGDGPVKAELESRLLADPDSRERVTFHGWVDERTLRSALPGMDAFFLCSRWEGLPVAMLQAMASGVACVVPDSPGGMRYALQDSAGGWTYHATSWRAAATALLGISRNRAEVTHRGRIAARIAREKFSPQVALGQFRDLRSTLQSLSHNGRVSQPTNRRMLGASLRQRLASRMTQLASSIKPTTPAS